MNRLTVTIVDILGVLVPGAVFLAGCLLIPPPLSPMPALMTLAGDPISLLSNPWIMAGIWLVIAYVLGFLVRLVSIPIMNRITIRKWSKRVKEEASSFELVFDQTIANPALSAALKRLAALQGTGDPGFYAPYFHFAKRLIRKHPELWTEAERLEAEARFVAGLFVPFLLLFVDGVFFSLAQRSALVLVAIGAAGAGIVFLAFPSRRAREMLYDQLLALVLLLYPDGSERKALISQAEAPNTRPQAGGYAAA